MSVTEFINRQKKSAHKSIALQIKQLKELREIKIEDMKHRERILSNLESKENFAILSEKTIILMAV